MADDTREPTAPPAQSPVEQSPDSSKPKPKYEAQSQVGKLWEAFGTPEEQANMLPTANGKKSNDLSAWDTMKSILSHANSFYKTPCARDALMLGMGAGFGVGGVRGVLGGMRSIWSASNWAVGIFVITSFASHEFCQRRRIEELDGMKQAVELMKELKIKKQKEKEQKIAEAARLAEEERKRKSWTHLPNYKFW